MSANWKEVEELFANAERMRYHWRDADPDSEQIARQLQEILTRVAATATEQRDNIGRRNARFRSFGMDLSDEQRQQYKDAAIKDEYVNDALDKTNRQLAAITSEDALDAEIRRHHSPAAAERARFAKAPARHDWSDLLQTIGSFLATWKLKNLHKFVKHHAKNMEQDVVRLMMTQDPDKKITTTALIFKALDIDKALRTIQNISGMSADAIYEACPGLSRAVPEPPEPILRNQCFEDRIRYLLETQKAHACLEGTDGSTECYKAAGTRRYATKNPRESEAYGKNPCRKVEQTPAPAWHRLFNYYSLSYCCARFKDNTS